MRPDSSFALAGEAFFLRFPPRSPPIDGPRADVPAGQETLLSHHRPGRHISASCWPDGQPIPPLAGEAAGQPNDAPRRLSGAEGSDPERWRRISPPSGLALSARVAGSRQRGLQPGDFQRIGGGASRAGGVGFVRFGCWRAGAIGG